MIESNPQTHQINLAGAQQYTYEYTVDRINKVMDSIKFFESLPPKDLLDLIKQQMKKHNVYLNLVNGYHNTYLDGIEHNITIGTITHACQILWEIINELENKCNPDLINNQRLTQ